jgi:small subunit ribosomal protein S16
MVVIRLSRGGTNKRPFYKVVVADRRASRDGCYLERVGFFNPIAAGKEKRLELNRERVNYWLSKGAQPSERVASLLLELDKPEILEKRKVKNTARKARKTAKAEVQLEADATAKDASKEESAAESK